MKKILFVVPEDYGFVSHRMLLAKKMIALGWEVVVATRVNHHADAIRESGVKLLTIGGAKDKRHSSSIRTIIRLINIYKHERPNIVHHFTIRMVILGSIAAKFSKNKAIVNTITGLGSAFICSSIKYRVIRSVVSVALRMLLPSSIITVQNHDDYKFIKELGIAEEKIHLILGSGVDVARYSPSKNNNKIPLVILPSRMLWVKGVGEFVDAARSLRRESVNCRCILVGDNDNDTPASISNKQLSDWQSEGVVEWWGHSDNMEDTLAKADIICLPSYREGLPKSLLEAAASGLPIITTDVPGCREVVEHKVNGFLVPSKDYKSLARALKILIEGTKIRLKMGKMGREKILNKFSSDIIDQQKIDLYQNLMCCIKNKDKRE
jgi:glycosyltransferase involved in cell wall biosynthesis